MSDDLRSIAVGMAAGVAVSITLPLVSLLVIHHVLKERRLDVKRVLSLSLIISSFSWPSFSLLFLSPPQRMLSSQFETTTHELASYFLYMLVVTFTLAPLSTLGGLIMLFLYLFSRIAFSLRVVLIFFAANWMLAIIYLAVLAHA